MSSLFVIDQCTDIYIEFLTQHRIVTSPFLKQHLESVFTTYALLSTKAEINICSTNDLFEHTGTSTRSRTANAMKKDLKKIATLLDEVQRLIHFTKGGQQLLNDKNTSKQISSINVLKEGAMLASDSIVLSGGRSQSSERKARLDMILELRAIAEYYDLSFPLRGQHNRFADIVFSIYDLLGVQVTDMGGDFKDTSDMYTSEYKSKYFINFKYNEKR